VICVDAVFFAPDVVAAMAEAGRLLRPGGRYVFTLSQDPDSPDPARRVVDEHVLGAGLELLGKEVRPNFAESVQRMYDLWVAHADEIAAEVGQEVADKHVEEAQSNGPTLARRTAYVVTARKPV
jgi:SAM-dependent methyltransferase